MSNAVPYLIQGKNIILVIDGKSHTISKDTHIAYGKIVDALKAQDWDTLRECVEPAKAIVNFGKGYVAINGGSVSWKGQPFHNALATRMVEMYQDGFPIDPMVRFMENLMQNPSKRSVDQVYGFLEKNSLPITEDGYFLAYKRVNNDYTDCHTGKIDNSIGEVVEMDRNLVDDNPDSHCSTGLHFCSISYLGSFGSADQPVMILKINPADVVSIPTDYDGAKGRCMKYEVVAEVDGDPKDAFAQVVDKKYAPKTTLSPMSAWPFATSSDTVTKSYVDHVTWPFATSPAAEAAETWPMPEDDSCGNDCAGCTCGNDEDEDQLYDLQRVYGEWVEQYDLTLEEARAKVAKNIAQKKALLKIVKAGTDEEVQ